MINFYDSSRIEELKKKLIIYRIIFYIFLTIFIGFIISLSIIIEYKNKPVVMAIMVSGGIILSILLVFIYLYFLYPEKWLIKRIELMNRSIKHQVVGVVDTTKENATLRRNVVGKEITFIIDNNKSILFLEDNDIDFNFEKGKSYQLETYDNFIVSIMELTNE